MNLEDQLRRSLRREPPPSGFADRVAARIAADAGARASQPAPSVAGKLWMPLAASLIVAMSGGWMYERHRARVEAEHAAAQVELALRITGETLMGVQERLAALDERRRQRNAEHVVEGSPSGEPGSVR